MASPPSSRAPPSLKGITSTNDDPGACAVCSGPFSRKLILAYCCGKRVCDDCHRDCRDFIGSGSALQRCSFCHSSPAVERAIGTLKKQAKKGEAWAQFYLGLRYENGTKVSQSDYDAKRWYEKAEKQKHPRATYYLGRLYMDGRGGCSVDLSKARELMELAIVRDTSTDGVGDVCRSCLVGIADRVDNIEAESILVPLAEGGMVSAQNRLGHMLCDAKRIADAKQWFESAALQGDRNSAFYVISCCLILKCEPEANFWFKVVSQPDMMPDDSMKENVLESVGAYLRNLRNTCGGCGAALVGKRRHYCRQCKTYCYCSCECQKMHWNRTGEGGHRDECQRVKVLKEKTKMK